jgi:hypothetical protein
LSDLDHGRPAVFPSLGIIWQRLESDSHRRSLGLRPSEGGVLVARVAFEGSAWGILQPGDVLLTLDGESVGPDGTVPLRRGELVDHSYRVAIKHVGDSLGVRVLRAGKRLELTIPLKPVSLLVPEDRYDVRPSYFVFGGLLFCPLSRDYLKSWGSEWWKAAPHELCSIYETQIRSPERQDVVLLQKVLADKVNQGYHEYENHVVVSIDGVPLRNMRHLVELAESSEAPFFTVGLADGQRIVIDRARAKERERILLERYNVRHDRSEDLRAPKESEAAPKASRKRAVAKPSRAAKPSGTAQPAPARTRPSRA